MAADLLKKGRTLSVGCGLKRNRLLYDAAVILATRAASTSISSWNFQKISEAEGGAYMPDYSYNKDYPFAAFITNLGKVQRGRACGRVGEVSHHRREIEGSV